MPRRSAVRFAAPAVLALLAACAQPAPSTLGPLTAADLSAALMSAPQACAEGDATWTSEFAPGGAYAYSYQGARVEGTWRADGEGRVCTADAGENTERCYAVTRAPEGLTFRRDEGGVFLCRPA